MLTRPCVVKPARRFRAFYLPERDRSFVAPPCDPAPSPIRRRPWRLVILLLLTGLLVFAHGCHGDEDTELFLGPRFWINAVE